MPLCEKTCLKQKGRTKIMDYSEYDFKYATLILHDLEMKREIQEVLRRANFQLGRNVSPSPTASLKEIFVQRGWETEYQVTQDSPYLRFDLFKNKVAIEIETTDPADCYNDYLKFLLGYNTGRIEVGVEIVYDDDIRGANLPKISKVQKDLAIFRRVIPCPIWIIGLKT